MGWKRSKAATAVLPAEPALGRWLLVGVITAVVGMMLFILHALGRVNVLTVFNIWWLSLSPVLGWFFLFCLRGWLWGRAVNEHQFLHKEARYGQQQWERWAERYVAVLGSCILLPSGVTAKSIAKASAAEAEPFLSRTCHFGAEPPVTVAYLLKQGVAGVQRAISMLPDSVPLNVTVVADCIAGGQKLCSVRHGAAYSLNERSQLQFHFVTLFLLPGLQSASNNPFWILIWSWYYKIAVLNNIPMHWRVCSWPVTMSPKNFNSLTLPAFCGQCRWIWLISKRIWGCF